MPWTKDLAELEDRFRRRLLVVYVVVVTILVVTVSTFQLIGTQREDARRAFQQQITNVCYTTRENTLNLNAAVDQLVESVQTSKTLSAAEKAERIRFYQRVRGEVPTCPPR